MSTKAIRARDDWSQIQMRVENGESYCKIAKEIQVHPEQMRRALDASKRDKVLAATKPVREKVEQVKELVAELTGEVSDAEGQLALFQTDRPREVINISIQGLLQEMQEDSDAIRQIAIDAVDEGEKYVAIAARKASFDSKGVLITTFFKYQLEDQKDIHKHPGFNHLLTVIMDALQAFPEALAAVINAVDMIND